MRRIQKTLPFAFLVLICTAFAANGLLPAQTTPAQNAPAAHAHVFFRIQSASSVAVPLSGRLLIFVKQGSGDKEVNTSEFHLTDTWVAAREVHNLAPGAAVELDADELAFPKAFSALPAGNYEAQAVLDVDHSYNYGGRTPADWISSVVPLANWMPGGGAEPALILDHHPEDDPKRAVAMANLRAEAKPGIAQLEEFESPLLSRFWGHPVKIKAWVILPVGYADHPADKYPTAYWTHGFGGNIDGAMVSGLRLYERMKNRTMPPMIWVMLDESIPQGTHEFADSVNNGPWGAALTTEFIPFLESKYRMDAVPTGRLLNGHSSGGWATLQLQVNYPRIFGGAWSTSPDPSDFHNFSEVDLYAPNANLYHRPDGSAVPIFRDKGQVVATMEQFARLEEVLGPYGGQLSSFDWVFSPKGKSGAPQLMFDRETGNVNPSVLAYWHDHFDLSHLTEAGWADRGADLKGRIHLFVGTADTFYLDGSAHKFEAVLTRLGADPHFTYLPDRTHFDLYLVGKDNGALFDQIGAEMYAVARPGVDWKKAGEPKTPARKKKK
jgi:enterochelin esterase-like enzyme